ncbi:dTDP-4-dehydrorhamnose reductase [Neisseria arctica]|uniref:dTDP-4-dehydrorhamnose reductase n=1 Tax=Neisseria arctica TaxID=1470200 RepID=A0A0J0YSU0_9NEIS|nr:dTDP-4-dehydrorhamnose reductase [Neisseria arctica]KLT73162.1 dTDP-4-dehydrorhamnose reductase [Neisseria arctica]UOO87105.1 dTDP-4-dehydrorhamnose reductase [Neisseria arctica]
MRILLTGSKGQLGRCIKDRLPEDWELIAADSATLDITDAAAVLNMAQNFQPDAIINAAAYTAVDKAESESAKAFAVNARAVYNLAAAARAVHARFVHISTDYVFSGNNKVPYTESDAPEPQSVYGRSKLAGELLALSEHSASVVIRTSWVFSEYGQNFVKTMLKAAQERGDLHIVNDQIGTPTYAGDLAQTILTMLQQSDFPRGIYHYCGDKPASWYDFACTIFETAALQDPTQQPPRIHAIDSSGFPTPAARPAYSVLDCNKIQNTLGIIPADWQKSLAGVLLKLQA